LQVLTKLHEVMIQITCLNLINLRWQIPPIWRQ